MTDSGTENKKIPKKLVNSPFLKEIDALLLSGISLPDVKAKVTEKYGETFSLPTYCNRRANLKSQVKSIQALSVPKDPRQESIAYQLKTLGEDLEKAKDAMLDPSDPRKAVLDQIHKQLTSVLRKTAEYYEEVDHLGLIRFVLNMMHVRISMMHEMELKMGMVLRDNTDNLVRMMEAITESIEVHQTLGLKPRFGDPTVNLNVNVGAGGQVNIGKNTQSERNVRLEEVEKALMGLTGEARDQKLRDIAFKRVGISDASFSEVKGAEGDAKT